MDYRYFLFKHKSLFLLILFLPFVSCSGVASTNTPETLIGELREITVEDVNVQIGVGSPIPVDVFVSGTWPDLCAQLAQVTQKVDDYSIDISLLATPTTPNCPPDFLGVPFRIAVPLNSVELPEGSYEVSVNGISTTFEWKSNP